MNERELILEILMEMEKNGTFSHIIIGQVLDKYNYLEPRQKAMIKRISEGTTERRLELDYILNRYSKTPVSKMKPMIRQILRMGVYQILYMDSVPDSAACNEAVKLARKHHFQNLSGFVNGVLRTVSRQKENISYPDENQHPIEAVSIRTSMPVWILEMWQEQYGKDRMIRMAEAQMQERPVGLRFRENLPPEKREQLIDEMTRQKVQIRSSKLLPFAYQAIHMEGMQNIEAFQQGFFTVQDVSSMLPAECAGIRAGDLIVDLCAAPGGKSMQAAELLSEREREAAQAGVTFAPGCVISRDLTQEKADRIRENQERLGITCLKAEVFDALQTDQELTGKADVVFADLPCSGLGVIGRKTDIKYRMSEQQIEELVSLQRRILEASLGYLKPGGILMYSTCTVDRKENEEQVSWIQEHFPFQTEPLQGRIAEVLKQEENGSGMLQLFPGEHDTDGFFLARLRKRIG